MKIRFDRNEISGAFGDIGTDLPLVVGIILVSGLDSANVLFMFGIMQIATGIIYGIPMPIQPLKAVAVIAISQKLSGDIILGAGLGIGLVMSFLVLTGLINWISNVVPKSVIRGIQFGLGTSLALLAMNNYIQADGLYGYVLSAISFVLIVFLLGNRKCPPALLVILLGVVYAFLFSKIEPKTFTQSFGFALPSINTPNFQDIVTGFILLAIPQIPLSIGNSILATQKLTEDYFPEKKLGIKKIASTYSIINLINPFLGGIPVCHGSGGMAGHYTFGARTGGSVIIYGSLYLVLGLFFSQGFDKVVQVFPLPVLGVILIFEGFALARLIKDTSTKKDFYIALIVGLICVGVKHGFVFGLIVGTILHYAERKLKNIFEFEKIKGV